LHFVTRAVLLPIDGLVIARAAQSDWNGSENSACGARRNAISKRETPPSVPPAGSASAVIQTDTLCGLFCIPL
jgi:hypothetical protein